MILSFSDPDAPAGDSDTTRVIRLPPGETDLYKLCEADRIAEDVMAGRLDLASGHAALRALDRPRELRWHAMQVLGFGLASAAVAGLLRLPWLDIATAGVIGLLIGAARTGRRDGRPRLQGSRRRDRRRARRRSSRSRWRASSRRSTSTP